MLTFTGNSHSGPHTCALGRFTCKAPNCTWSGNFKTKQAFNRHYRAMHLSDRVDCPIEGCPRVGAHGIKRADNLAAHIFNKHNIWTSVVFLMRGCHSGIRFTGSVTIFVARDVVILCLFLPESSFSYNLRFLPLRLSHFLFPLPSILPPYPFNLCMLSNIFASSYHVASSIFLFPKINTCFSFSSPLHHSLMNALYSHKSLGSLYLILSQFPL